MTKHQMLADIKDTLGTVPDWMVSVPDHVLEHEWSIIKNFQLGETAIPNKYKELIGLGVAALLECPYCIHFHTEAAKFWGASQEEIAEALKILSSQADE
ncbi:MAG: carboxymuconolactone decarboxylase family protein [Chloroflexi bacterium]|nr:carboxymuconolactone decarboxylase family protein [Chloroflexota bacterium]